MCVLSGKKFRPSCNFEHFHNRGLAVFLHPRHDGLLTLRRNNSYGRKPFAMLMICFPYPFAYLRLFFQWIFCNNTER